MVKDIQFSSSAATIAVNRARPDVIFINPDFLPDVLFAIANEEGFHGFNPVRLAKHFSDPKQLGHVISHETLHNVFNKMENDAVSHGDFDAAEKFHQTNLFLDKISGKTTLTPYHGLAISRAQKLAKVIR